MNEVLIKMVKNEFDKHNNLDEIVFELAVNLLYACQIPRVDMVVGESYELWSMYPTCTYNFKGYGKVTSKKIVEEWYGLNFESGSHPEAYITVDERVLTLTSPLLAFKDTKQNIRDALVSCYPWELVDKALRRLYVNRNPQDSIGIEVTISDDEEHGYIVKDQS